MPDQKVNAVVIDSQRRRVYCSTEIYADANSAPPTQTTGQLVAFDMDELKIVRCQAIKESEGAARVMAVLPSGEVLAVQRNTFYAWKAREGVLRALGPAPSGCREVALDVVTGSLWTSASGKIGRMQVHDHEVEFTPLIEGEGEYLRIVDRTLYYAAGFEVCQVDLREFDG